jgi:hypothetical protein
VQRGSAQRRARSGRPAQEPVRVQQRKSARAALAGQPRPRRRQRQRQQLAQVRARLRARLAGGGGAPRVPAGSARRSSLPVLTPLQNACCDATSGARCAAAARTAAGSRAAPRRSIFATRR